MAYNSAHGCIAATLCICCRRSAMCLQHHQFFNSMHKCLISAKRKQGDIDLNLNFNNCFSCLRPLSSSDEFLRTQMLRSFISFIQSSFPIYTRRQLL
ncbi:hypothetical protein Ahy_B10g104268 isoform A [Arachis hypogaea]|uniref:Uncharacterized protein n=1 Tax=Arachis hypogaea TaxID=3818 RepID=A0A444X555_ARAHY|nr:hypothetical protein Ahy_B10g104268 isoform A [Arachis hypogaea]